MHSITSPFCTSILEQEETVSLTSLAALSPPFPNPSPKCILTPPDALDFSPFLGASHLVVLCDHFPVTVRSRCNASCRAPPPLDPQVHWKPLCLDFK